MPLRFEAAAHNSGDCQLFDDYLGVCVRIGTNHHFTETALVFDGFHICGMKPADDWFVVADRPTEFCFCVGRIGIHVRRARRERFVAQPVGIITVIRVPGHWRGQFRIGPRIRRSHMGGGRKVV